MPIRMKRKYTPLYFAWKTRNFLIQNQMGDPLISSDPALNKIFQQCFLNM